MTDEIINGINRRCAGEDSGSGSDFVMNKMLAAHGLPPAEASHDRKLVALQAELFELIERWGDAVEADRDTEAVFIDRQIMATIDRLKQHFSNQ